MCNLSTKLCSDLRGKHKHSKERKDNQEKTWIQEGRWKIYEMKISLDHDLEQRLGNIEDKINKVEDIVKRIIQNEAWLGKDAKTNSLSELYQNIGLCNVICIWTSGKKEVREDNRKKISKWGNNDQKMFNSNETKFNVSINSASLKKNIHKDNYTYYTVIKFLKANDDEELYRTVREVLGS